jgi:hypothetical protein
MNGTISKINSKNRSEKQINPSISLFGITAIPLRSETLNSKYQDLIKLKPFSNILRI